MATHSRTLAWKIPWMEEPGRLQAMGWLRVRHNLATEHSSKQHHKPDTGVNTKDIMVTK